MTKQQKEKNVVANRQVISAQFAQKRTDRTQIIRATLAEVVDFRAELQKKIAKARRL
ncbi:MAG: hypothetical protein HFG23_09550 [Anaerotruncus sp.]|jgi:hypothetical protein|nr:hypothetical protein [Anaerotruncus sp.]